jgi:hypothetical protein
MKAVRLTLSVLLIFGFSALTYAIDGPKSEIEIHDFQQPVAFKAKIPSKPTGSPIPPLPPGVVIRLPRNDDSSNLNSLGFDTKQSQLSTGFAGYGGASLPMLNSSTSPSHVEKLKGKIERVIKKLNL